MTLRPIRKRIAPLRLLGTAIEDRPRIFWMGPRTLCLGQVLACRSPGARATRAGADNEASGLGEHALAREIAESADTCGCSVAVNMPVVQLARLLNVLPQ